MKYDLRKLPKAVRYIISGGTGAAVNIGIFFVLVHVLGLWYLASSVCAFTMSVFVGFYLQRRWTFRQSAPQTMNRQAVRYFLVALFNLACNTVIVYAAVEYLRLWYLASQILAGGIVAIASFFIYKHLVFTSEEGI